MPPLADTTKPRQDPVPWWLSMWYRITDISFWEWSIRQENLDSFFCSQHFHTSCLAYIMTASRYLQNILIFLFFVVVLSSLITRKVSNCVTYILELKHSSTAYVSITRFCNLTTQNVQLISSWSGRKAAEFVLITGTGKQDIQKKQSTVWFMNQKRSEQCKQSCGDYMVCRNSSWNKGIMTK